MQIFRKIFDEGKDILHLTLSSGISGSYNSACIAAEQVREEYPNRKIYVVDSLAASSGYGLLVDTLADRRDAGESIDELYAWVCENKKKLQHWFLLLILLFYQRRKSIKGSWIFWRYAWNLSFVKCGL